MDPSARVRPPAVAGRFYPSRAAQLRATIDELLANAHSPVHPSLGPPKGLIAPHAGLVYSGPIAATAYASVRARADEIRKVVLLGPAHRVAFAGLALPAAERFATPLGEIEIDPELRAIVAGLPQVLASEQAHALEHSLELQLPFLQAFVPVFTLLPLVVGDASPAAVAEVLDAVWGGPETLIVLSSDLSHYLPYADAQRRDRNTAAWIVASHPPGLSPTQACGARCIDGVLELGRARPLGFELLDLRNSGDTAGTRDQVVGYGAFAIRELETGAPA